MNQTDRRPTPITTEMAGNVPSFTGEANTEAHSNESMIEVLNSLIETCRDGQNGFKQAAEGVERSDLKTVFYEYSQQRASYVGDLQTFVQTLGGDPEETGSLAGVLHRGWINIKAAVTGKDDTAILNEAERGEDAAKAAYQEALKVPFPNYIMETLESQFMGVQEAHDRVKMLRNTSDAGEISSSARTGY